MSGISPKRFRNSADKNVEEKHRAGHWKVFDHYDLKEQHGNRYLYAPRATDDARNESWSYSPLSRGHAGLFLEFSNWPVECGMDKAIETTLGLSRTLDTDRNAVAAKEWAKNYGVLGLGTNPNGGHSIGSSMSLSLVAARYTGAQHLGHPLNRAYRNSPRGGTHETVEAFAFEAWQAHLARRLYEMASRKVLYEAAIVRLMDDTPLSYAIRPAVRIGPSEKEQWSKDPWSIRRWALGIVEEAVMLKVERDCYPTLDFVNEDLTGEGWPISYKQGWGIKSLLGAMWLQMMWLMIGEDNTCEWCGRLFEKTRADKRFCNADCRQNWNYHKGRGKSSKQGKKRTRENSRS